MKTTLHLIENSSLTIFSERLSNILKLVDNDQIIHIEFMERASTSMLNNIIHVAYILVRENE